MTAPLPDRVRPRLLDDVSGQQRWLGPDGALRRDAERGELSSLVFWGPPGCGKTTLARMLSQTVQARFVQLSAVLDGVKRLREVVDEAASVAETHGARTVVFVDEIHRWNKAQQDALLPHVEAGTVTLLGATTENPSFELNAALRSRVRVVRLDPLADDDVVELLERAIAHPEGLGRPDLTWPRPVLAAIAQASAGDARRALLDLERIAQWLDPAAEVSIEAAATALQRGDIRHDRSGDDHYDVVSALIKSLRGTDPDAALYWLARMIEGGESVRFIVRRLIIFASEDVGNADPRALLVATAAADAADRVGYPEARIILGQAVTYLACAPKSNASYKGINAALSEVKQSGALPVPFHLRNAPTEDMKREGFESGYLYPHDFPYGIVRQPHLPARLLGRRFYEPTAHGDEKTTRARLTFFQSKLDERDG